MRDISENGIDEKELLKVKQQFKGSAMLHLESMQSRMSRIAKMEIFEKELQTIDQLLEIINRISAEDIKNVATYLYDEKKFVESRILPAK